MYRAIFALFLFGVILGLSACNTVSGVGKDISDTAEWTKNHL